jgi:hypothetical protein
MTNVFHLKTLCVELCACHLHLNDGQNTVFQSLHYINFVKPEKIPVPHIKYIILILGVCILLRVRD